jgi:hypothetical protein
MILFAVLIAAMGVLPLLASRFPRAARLVGLVWLAAFVGVIAIALQGPMD